MTTVVLGSESELPVVEALGGGVSVDDEDDVGVNVDFESDVVLDDEVDDDEDEEEIGTAAHISVKTALVVLKSGRLQRDWAQETESVINVGLEQRQAVSVNKHRRSTASRVTQLREQGGRSVIPFAEIPGNKTWRQAKSWKRTTKCALFENIGRK